MVFFRVLRASVVKNRSTTENTEKNLDVNQIENERLNCTTAESSEYKRKPC